MYKMLVELIARNRNLSTETIKSTEAGLYFGKNAIEIGLADGITTFSEFINQQRSFIMTEQPINKEQSINTDDLIGQGRRSGRESYRAEILEVIRLCSVLRMPEKIAEFIEQDVSSKQAQEILMSILAERTTKAEIFSTLPQNSSESLVMKAAKARQNAQI